MKNGNRRYDGIRPRAVFSVANECEVAHALSLAAAEDLPVAVRSGGHSYAGFSTGTGIVIDVRSLNHVTVKGRRIDVGGGANSAEVGRALARAGLALPIGRCPTIGIAGLTLGGGKSMFSRAWGLTCDRLTAADIVTADGRTLSVNPQSGDLFWALRGGGGGNFGVITAMEYEAIDVRGKAFARFTLAWPFADTSAVIAGWLSWLRDESTPRELGSDLSIMAMQGRAARPTVQGAIFGDPRTLRPALDRLVATVGRPVAQMTIRPCSFPEASTLPETLGADLAWAGKSHIVRGSMSEHAIAELVDHLRALTAMNASGGIYLDSLGGAVADVPCAATAFPHREGAAILQYVSVWDRRATTTQVDRRLAWLRGAHGGMQAHLGIGAYVNDTDPELPGWERAYYGANYPRLQTVKARYDPNQLFRFAQSVQPGGLARAHLHPPAPWILGGTQFSGTFIAVEPSQVTVVVSRHSQGTLRYHELFVGTWVSHEPSPAIRAIAVWVDDLQACLGGRRIWGLPKRLATFAWGESGVRVFDSGGPIADISYEPAPRRPIATKTPTEFLLLGRKDGRWVRSTTRVEGTPCAMSMRVNSWRDDLPALLRPVASSSNRLDPCKVTVEAPR